MSNNQLEMAVASLCKVAPDADHFQSLRSQDSKPSDRRLSTSSIFVSMKTTSPIPQEALSLLSEKSKFCLQNLLEHLAALEHADLSESVLRTLII